MRWALLPRLSGLAALVLWGACRQNPQDAAATDAAATDVADAPAASIAIDAIDHLDRRHYRIRTPSATYLLDAASGGLSSMIDVEGNDWIAFGPEPWGEYPPSAASSYRGVPNLVFGGELDGAGHPGHSGVRTTVTSDTTVACATPGGPWAWTWRFRESHALLDVTGVSDTAAYWFLYEGPVGGRYQPRQTYVASSDSPPAYPQYDHFEGGEEVAQRRWYYFGNDDVGRVLYMLQVEPDTLVDHYSLLGDDTVGIYSLDGMAVAGFGRAPMATPVLRDPNRFVIGFLEGEGSSAPAYRRKATRLAEMLR